MKDQLITFETAKLAKEKGFNIETLDRFDINTVSKNYMNYDSIEYDWNYCPPNMMIIALSKPTQTLLQCWLREVHHIHICLDYFVDGSNNDGWFELKLINVKTGKRLYSNHTFDVYEQALEFGMQKALEII